MSNYSTRPYPNKDGYFQVFDTTNPNNFNFQSTMFRSESDAMAYTNTCLEYWKFLDYAKTIPAAISRDEYETLCRQNGITPRDDKWCAMVAKDSNPFDLQYYSVEQYASVLESGKHSVLCNRRYAHIRANRETQPRPLATVTMVMCDCGHSVPAGQRMSASLGTACPDCYDRMS